MTGFEAEISRLDVRTVYETRRFRVEEIRERLDNGVEETRPVVRHPGAAVVLPVTELGEIVLVEQYRTSVGRTLLEIPAGTLEPGELPERAAERELAEETGYRARRIERLVDLLPAPGLTDEIQYVYLATELIEGAARPEPDERLRVRRLAPSALADAIRRGECCDSKTIAAFLFYERFIVGSSR